MKKKRIAIYKKYGITVQLDLDFQTEEELFRKLDDIAIHAGILPGNISVFTLGTKEQMNEGYVYFCPRCGKYHPEGIKPIWELLYQKDDDEDLVEAGQYKVLTIDCQHCVDEFYINSKTFQNEVIVEEY
ncbi:hypothetical protein [Viridibacillus arvi]|uniref:hypothetical protein n=1 Tax=Viridibacillus arvi TaxID=263475 RepID=UPI0034CD063D